MMDEHRELGALFRELSRAPLKTFPLSRETLDAPIQMGVYVIYDPKGRVLHVGSTPRAKRGIAQRLRDHMFGRSSFTIKQYKGDGFRLRGKHRFRYLVVENGRKRALLEALAIGRLCPHHIGGGRNGEI